MGSPQVIGRYEIIDELGHGAMGSVFKARDPAVGRLVAVKTIHSAALAGGQSEEFRARFYREARASGVLAHPGIVPVFDVGEHEGAPFLVMEFVDGRTLADALKKGERYSLDRVCEVGQQIADALGYAHRQGVIHRDIKPANILLTSPQIYGSERPRITDFGIAKLAASEITTTGQLLGTPSFMPPEQFTGMPIDGRADLFSLGVILYSMATGEQPFPGETMTAVSYKIVYTEPVPPAKLNPAIPQRLEAAILKCLAKSPMDRYQTGDEIARDLAAIRASMGMQTSIAVPAIAGDMTLGPGQISAVPPPSHTTAGPVAPVPVPGPATPAKKPAKRRNVETIFAVVLLSVAVLGAAAWFLITRHNPPVPATQTAGQSTTASTQQAQTAQAPQTQTQPQTQPKASAPAAGTAPSAQSKPSAAKPKASPAAPPPAPSAPAPAPNAPPAKPAATPAAAAAATTPPKAPAAGFDPRKLDPNTNAKLKIDVSKFPNGLAIVVEMNKQSYLHFTTGDGSSLDNLFVPPGVQQFRVSFKNNGQEWDSNIVSEDFKAKKRKTLKLQLLVQDKALSKITLPISKDAQLFLSFSTSLADSLPF